MFTIPSSVSGSHSGAGAFCHEFCPDQAGTGLPSSLTLGGMGGRSPLNVDIKVPLRR
jgi:hypothetical protein